MDGRQARAMMTKLVATNLKRPPLTLGDPFRVAHLAAEGHLLSGSNLLLEPAGQSMFTSGAGTGTNKGGLERRCFDGGLR